MRKLLGLGICLALAACAGQPVKKPAKCEGPMRPANPHGLTLPSVPDQAEQRTAPANVDVFNQGAPATPEVPEVAPGNQPEPGNKQSDASKAVEVPRLSASLRGQIFSNC